MYYKEHEPRHFHAEHQAQEDRDDEDQDGEQQAGNGEHDDLRERDGEGGKRAQRSG